MAQHSFSSVAETLPNSRQPVLDLHQISDEAPAAQDRYKRNLPNDPPVISGERALAEEYVKSHTAKAKQVMTQNVQTAHPETRLNEIAERIPIVNDAGDLVGIVSRANIIQALASSHPKLEISSPDATIRERLVAELKKHSWSHLYKLNVTVVNGVVDLWGLSDSEPERQAIRVAAESIPGVTAVNDHLAPEPASFF